MPAPKITHVRLLSSEGQQDLSPDDQILIDDDHTVGTRCRTIGSLIKDSDELYFLKTGRWP